MKDKIKHLKYFENIKNYDNLYTNCSKILIIIFFLLIILFANVIFVEVKKNI